ncbi:hypothetical protein Anas_06934 [Armadillidium nasatum]|uniref:Uncharacterized protein n=1 Tax=Armadillidium nasatum TaxID=96803 RepID=A0A5N5SUA1_9CRUS|nr:hypothetical protein Anas_06934 [Armadillidium nasatum]
MYTLGSLRFSLRNTEKMSEMEQAQNTSGMVWYNYGVDGILTSAPLQVEIGSDIARQLNHQVQIQYGGYSTVSTIPSQSQHVIVAHQPGRRGRPRKRGKRGRKTILNKKIKGSDSAVKKENEETIESADTSSHLNSMIKFESPVLSTQEVNSLPIETETVEITVGIVDSNAVTSENSVIIRPTNKDGSILPTLGNKEILHEDVIQAAANAAGLSDSADLRQEAAVTMAALQHGALNLVHQGDSSPDNTEFTSEGNGVEAHAHAWYIKQE